jgi:SRSO17 transposase
MMTELEALPDRLHRYLDGFRGGFRRREQREWAAVYLHGLLESSARKNVETLARTVPLPSGLGVEDVAQALGHFLSQSPWDEAVLLRQHQQRLASKVDSAPGVFVLDEMAFAKQGRHSVGVQRQYSWALRRKTNCQVAVLLHYLGPFGPFPVGFRLYLPRGWLADEARLDQAGVPAEARRSTDRLGLGLELLDAARDAGLDGVTLAAGPGWLPGEEMAMAAAGRGLVLRESLPPEQAAPFEVGRALLEQLGLGHFEGRSWRGFHHHAGLVLLAAGFQAGV